MKITVRHFLVSKLGADLDMNDDAAASNLSRAAFAISDGACESGFSKIWSRVLVDAFVEMVNEKEQAWKHWLNLAQTRWNDELKDVEIPWYGEEQFESGAFATFLGVRLKRAAETGDIVFIAEAVGDSCLFHVRKQELVCAFPLKQSREFSTLPQLVGSRGDAEQMFHEKRLTLRGKLISGDQLCLMSDALAKWTLEQIENGASPWEEVSKFAKRDATYEQFDQWVQHLRSDRGLHNDDITLMIVST